MKQHPEFPAFCASKWEFSRNKNQPETIAEDCPARLLSLHTLFPWCHRAECGAEDLPCSCFFPGFDFPGEGFTPLRGAPRRAGGEQVLGSWCRLVANTHYKLSVRVTGNAQHKLHFSTLATAVAKAAEGLDAFSSKDESFHISSLKELFIDLKWPKRFIYNEGKKKTWRQTLLFHRNTGACFTFVFSYSLIASKFAFYSSLSVMEMDILIKAVIPARRRNVASFNMRFLMNVSKPKKKKEEKIYSAKDF